MDITVALLDVLEDEASRGFAVTGDVLSTPAQPLTRAEVLEMPESIARRLAAYFVKLVDTELNTLRPPLVFVPSR